MKDCPIVHVWLLKLLPGRIERCRREARWVGFGPAASTLRIIAVEKHPADMYSGFLILGFPATIQITGGRMDADGDAG